MDGWVERHTGERFDRHGAWARRGSVIEPLLSVLAADPYFALPPPKSTGRDRFNLDWLTPHLHSGYAPEDVQRTLARLSAVTIAEALRTYCTSATEVVLCGGGALNSMLVQDLETLLAPRSVPLSTTLGVPLDHVEALAFAWLAREALARRPGNLPAVTGARGTRVLGAIYPA
jgi:anhydro-N-acetylmuramic acid kinase